MSPPAGHFLLLTIALAAPVRHSDLVGPGLQTPPQVPAKPPPPIPRVAIETFPPAARDAISRQYKEAASDAHWLQLRLEQPGNRQGMGALVGVERAGRPTVWRRVKTDGSYASASDSRVQVGLGTTGAPDAVVVHWPDGRRERWTSLQADRLVTVRRGTGTLLPAAGDKK